MTFLPIVERELRVGARRRGTVWTRVTAAGMAFTIFLLLELLNMAAKGSFSAAMGQVQFAVLGWLSFAYACGAGLFLTSDALSEEKREGTLGLLFLTDLRGHDVVLGKLIANSTRAFYALLAAFPIMALTLLMGGVAVGQFWLTVLVICNTLFLSIALGLFVSSLSREAQRSMNGVVLGLLILLGIAPLADFALAGWNPGSFKPLLSVLSPGYLFAHVGHIRAGDFWFQLAAQNVLSWVFLGFSCFFTPRAWQEKSRRGDATPRALGQQWRFGSARSRGFGRQKLLNREPLLWLASRDRWLRLMAWGVSVVALVLLVWGVLNDQNFTPTMSAITSGSARAVSVSTTNSTGTTTTAYSYSTSAVSVSHTISTMILQTLGRLMVPVIELWVAVQACRFFVEAVRNGAMELILVAPVGPDQIVLGHWRALRRTFMIPALTAALYSIAVLATSLAQTYAMTLASRGTPRMSFDMVTWEVVGVVAGLINFFANLAALAWFGMWMGLTNRKPTIATLKTIAFVVVLPKIALSFVQGFLMVLISFSMIGRSGSGMTGFWVSSIVVCLLTVGKDVFFILFARQRLSTRFREAVAWEGHGSQQRGVQPHPRYARAPVVSPPPLPAGTAGPGNPAAGGQPMA
jgi:ABC-type transport system involved in cytochrome c biogenesis permease component